MTCENNPVYGCGCAAQPEPDPRVIDADEAGRLLDDAHAAVSFTTFALGTVAVSATATAAMAITGGDGQTIAATAFLTLLCAGFMLYPLVTTRSLRRRLSEAAEVDTGEQS